MLGFGESQQLWRENKRLLAAFAFCAELAPYFAVFLGPVALPVAVTKAIYEGFAEVRRDRTHNWHRTASEIKD